jgi:hypothetical protein
VRFYRQFLVALLILLIPLSVYSSDLGEVYLRFIAGDIQIRPAGTADWTSVSANTPLLEGDQILIPEGGRAELSFRDGTLLRLDQNSALEIVSLQKDRFQLYLDAGHAYVNRAGSGKKPFVLETPSVSLSTSRQSTFKADVSDHGDVEIAVADGKILARRDGREEVIKTGERFVFLRDMAGPERTALLPPDQWEEWNLQRDDNSYAQGPSSRYLPDELGPYAQDFDQYGTWVNTPDYGYVWAPIVVGGWSPYGYGRWVSIRGSCVWIPYEPWGWVPHHYGRWIYRNQIGWGWVPPRKGIARWAPGYVGWSYTPASVSWVPLAPQDPYDGRGYPSPDSINVAKIGISNGQPKSRFTNARVKNAVTTVTTEGFPASRALSTIASDSEGGSLGQSRDNRARNFHDRESGTSIHSATGFASAPVQVGDVLVWKSSEANGVRSYLVSNLPQGLKRLSMSRPMIGNPAAETAAVALASAGPRTTEAVHTDRVVKPRGTGELARSTSETKAGQPVGRTEFFRFTSGYTATAGSRQAGIGNANALTTRATGSSSSGPGSRGSSRGFSRGRR